MQTPRQSSHKMPNNDSTVPIERNTSHFLSKNRKTETTRQRITFGDRLWRHVQKWICELHLRYIVMNSASLYFGIVIINII